MSWGVVYRWPCTRRPSRSQCRERYRSIRLDPLSTRSLARALQPMKQPGLSGATQQKAPLTGAAWSVLDQANPNPLHSRSPLSVQHLVSQIAVVSCWIASLHSLTTLVGRRTVQFPPADHSRGSRLSLMPYLIFVCCPRIQQRDRRRRRIGRLFPSVRSSVRTVLWFAARPSTFFCRCGQGRGINGGSGRM